MNEVKYDIDADIKKLNDIDVGIDKLDDLKPILDQLYRMMSNQSYTYHEECVEPDFEGSEREGQWRALSELWDEKETKLNHANNDRLCAAARFDKIQSKYYL